KYMNSVVRIIFNSVHQKEVVHSVFIRGYSIINNHISGQYKFSLNSCQSENSIAFYGRKRMNGFVFNINNTSFVYPKLLSLVPTNNANHIMWCSYYFGRGRYLVPTQRNKYVFSCHILGNCPIFPVVYKLDNSCSA